MPLLINRENPPPLFFLNNSIFSRGQISSGVESRFVRYSNSIIFAVLEIFLKTWSSLSSHWITLFIRMPIGINSPRDRPARYTNCLICTASKILAVDFCTENSNYTLWKHNFAGRVVLVLMVPWKYFIMFPRHRVMLGTDRIGNRRAATFAIAAD
jgi:hypothetical protein